MTISSEPAAHTRRSSDLSRHSAEVFAEAEKHPVTVTRRDGEALVLMSQREAESRADLLSLASRLMTVALGDNGTLEARMCKAFPWMLALSPTDREECSRELLEAALASFSTNQPYLALTEYTSWKETAEALAAGLGDADIVWLQQTDVESLRQSRRASVLRKH